MSDDKVKDAGSGAAAPRIPFLGLVAFVAVLAAVLRMTKDLPYLDPTRIDATTLGFLCVPLAWALMRDAKKLKLSTSGLEFERLEERLDAAVTQISTTKAEVRETRKDVREAKESLDMTRLAMVHRVGKLGGTALPAGTATAGTAPAAPNHVREARTSVAPGGAAPVVDSEDPQRGRWGRSPERNGRRLTADVRPVQGEDDWFLVRLTVESTDPGRPLEGTVTFHLHPTFLDPDPIAPVHDGKATLTRIAWGAFTVGAEADNGQTQLELNLADLPGAPPAFRAR